MIFCEIPIAATASEPKDDVKLFKIVMPVTFKRFWIAAGIPTLHIPIKIGFWGRNIDGRMQTYVLPRFINNKTKK